MIWEAPDFENTQRIVDAHEQPEDARSEVNLRPKTLDDYLGQGRIKDNLSVLIQAARMRGEALDHLLFSGPPGLGKTTLASVVANEMGVQIRTTSGPAIDRAGDLAAILTNLEEGDILFIDEIHRLNRPSRKSSTPPWKTTRSTSSSARALQPVPYVWISPASRSSPPPRVRACSPAHCAIASARHSTWTTTRATSSRTSSCARPPFSPSTSTMPGAYEIASRARATPRLANRLLRRVRDFSQVRCNGFIDEQVAREALAFFEVDELGLDPMDNRILDMLVNTFEGRPVGLSALASALGEEVDSIEDVYEPFLLKQGLVNRTPKGRQATHKAFAHLGVPYPVD